ncbi:hypothetical protein Tco_0882673 [Tanacetum coccineum]|uniref:Uncharacterized protein n=1 Tax=Tanacetum coccineum TaxID=301880 RepID=A0ABQ4X1M5_9ASTR
MNQQKTEQVIAHDEGWFWYTITKLKGSDSYKFLLANKECEVDAKVFRKILDICPRKEGEDFTKVQKDEDTLTFLIDLGYSRPLHKDNVDYPSLIWEDIAYQIDHRRENKSRQSYQRFLLYSTGLIPPKKSRDKVEEVKKKPTISAANNIVLDPDLALELGKSISLTEAEEEADAREVCDTHIPRVPDESTIVFTTSTEETGTKLGVPNEEKIILEKGAEEASEHFDRDVDAEDDDEETEYDSKDIYKYKIKVQKDVDDKMKDAETIQQELKEKEELTDADKTDVEEIADLIKETTEQPLTSSSLSMSSDYGTQFLNLSHNEETFEQPPVTSTISNLQQTTPIPTTIPTPPSFTKAIPKITPLIAVQLRVTKFEQDVSKLKKTDHSAAALAYIQSQVHTVVDKYLGTKLDNALLKALETHYKFS